MTAGNTRTKKQIILVVKPRSEHYRLKLKTTPVIQVNAALHYLSQLKVTRFKPMREVDAFLLRQMNLQPKVK